MFAFHAWLMRRRIYRKYRWAILPLIVVLSLQLNIHTYYRLAYGYDFDQHLINVISILEDGTMPLPPVSSYVYEADQAPIFYILTAAVVRLGEWGPLAVAEPFQTTVSVMLLLMALAWIALMTIFVQWAMRRMPGMLKALTLCVVMLFPVNVKIAAMFNNDLPEMVLLMGGAMLLWALPRSARTFDRAMWIRTAAVIGLAVAFKNNALILVVTYVALAAAVIFKKIVRYRLAQADRVLVMALVGLPLMVVPLALNGWHMQRYVDDLFHVPMAPRPIWDNFPLTFFTTFDTSLFENPFAYGPGERSFWSLQYVTLHNDYFNHWNSPAYDDIPVEARHDTGHRQPIPFEKFDQSVWLQVLALPITLVMVFGFFVSLYRTIRRPRDALREGSLVIVFLTLITEGAQFWRFSLYAYERAALIHARFYSFLFVILFVVGVAWYWRLWGRRRHWVVKLVTVLLVIDMLTYSTIALLRMWLPPG